MVARRFGCNIGTLVGYSTLRRGLVGDQTAPLSSQELGALKAALQRALDEGALGLSTGLSYAHEIETSELELYELAQVVKSKEALLSIHLRNEAGEIIDSVREAVNLAQQAGAKVKISHLKIRNSVNWPKLEELLTELETAWHKGAQLHYDVYPYTSIWQVLYSYLPKWSIAGGRHHMLEQLRNPTQRNKILTHLNNSESPLKELVIASTASNLNINGKTISKLAKDMEISSEQAILRLIENGGSEVLAFDNCLSEDGVEELSNHALGYIASDGAGFPLSVKDKLVHPRCFGAAPKFLSQVIASKKISLPEAVRKLTAGPAETVGLKNRGVIKTGNFADIVIFDEQRIRDCATLTNPYQFAEGIIHVLVNGQSAVHSGQLIGTDNGKFLTRN
jgi:N-acyl-D-aspartate/D-glutamate deacylase